MMQVLLLVCDWSWETNEEVNQGAVKESPAPDGGQSELVVRVHSTAGSLRWWWNTHEQWRIGGILKRRIFLSDIYAVFELGSQWRGSESLQTSFVTDQLGRRSVWTASKCWPVLLSDLFLILPWQLMRCLCSFFSRSTNLGGSSLLISQLDAWQRQGRWRSDPPSLSCPVRPNSLGILKRKKIH